MSESDTLVLLWRISALALLLLPALLLWPLASYLRRRRSEGVSRFMDTVRRGVPMLTSLLFLAGGIGFTAGVAKVFLSARVKAHSFQCQSRVKALSLALMMYAQDWDETYPPATRWADCAAPRLRAEEADEAFHCPSAPSPHDYAFHQGLDQMSLHEIWSPSEAIVVFESDATTRNAVGDRRALSQEPRHTGGWTFGFADGHAKWANAYTEARWSWEVDAAE